MAGKAKFISLAIILSIPGISRSQDSLEWYQPAPVLNKTRLLQVSLAEAAATTGAFLMLSNLWYAEQPQSNFHLFNDNNTWLQMDKVGHSLSAYQLGLLNGEVFQWTGLSQRKALTFGAASSFLFLSGVEVMDGFASNYGFSTGDVLANASGSALLLGQELLWKEQRLLLRFSYAPSPYRKFNPDLLGQSPAAAILKDYNGHTYWLSGNVRAFTGWEKWPEWLNMAVGYSGTGMLANRYPNSLNNQYPGIPFRRQFFLAPDIDLSRLPIESPFWKGLFKALRFLKFPSPALAVHQSGGIRWHWLYF